MPNLPPKSATPPSEVSRLRELQRQFATGIMRPLTPEQTMHPEWADGSPSAEAVAGFIKSNNRLSSIERLEIYNRQYWYRLIDCFYEDFPGLRTLLGDRVFSALTEAYLTRYRSRSFTLRDLGQDLGKFLVDEPKWTEKHAKLARDIVRLEWAQIVAFDGEAFPPLEVDELLGKDPATLKLSLQPHLTLLSCDYPVDNVLGPHFFPPNTDGTDPRLCPRCSTGRMGLKLGKFGAFLGCSNYPTCKNTRPLAVTTGEEGQNQMVGPRELGDDPTTGLPVSARVGPYGAYIQLGPLPSAGPPPAPPEPEAVLEDSKKKKKRAKKKDDAPKPKRMSLPKGMDPNLIDLATAVKLLELPRDIGKHPESGDMITAGIGRFGAYIKLSQQYKSLAPDDDVLNIGLNRAVVLLAEPGKGNFGRGAATPGKSLGEHPEDQKPITLNKGRFGPYVKWGKVMATVTKSYDPENLSLKDALEIIAAKVAKGPSTFGKKAGGKKSSKPAKETASEMKAEVPKKTTPKKAKKQT